MTRRLDDAFSATASRMAVRALGWCAAERPWPSAFGRVLIDPGLSSAAGLDSHLVLPMDSHPVLATDSRPVSVTGSALASVSE